MTQAGTGLYLGIDAGGTKTHAVLADFYGRVQAFGRAGTGNWELIGLDGMRDTLQQLVGQVIAQAGATISAIKASAYGLAGLDWPSDKPPLESTITQLNLPGHVVIVNDMFVALRAGTDKSWGVVVGAGTGFAAAGRNRNGETARTLGLSPDWGDWGGGRNIAQAAVAAVARAYIGLEPPTLLSESLTQYAGMPNVESLLQAVSRDHLELTSATPLIFEAASAGDDSARAILERAGREMAANTNLIIRKLYMEKEAFDLVLAGSLFKAQEPLLIDTLINDIQAFASHVHPIKLVCPPAIGALLLAMEADGLQPSRVVRQNLMETVRAFTP
jgi:N-acetylglucosamine kinase-like BadF-type ATPase